MSKNIMEYKGYAAKVEYSHGDGLFAGRIAGIKDIVSFHGSTVDELQKNFKEAVDDYVEFCEQEGMKPQRPYSGKLMLRIDPSLHAQIAKKAELDHVPINKWISGTLEKELHS